MPTLPLIADPSPADADAPRGIMAPGGYEWWYFEAHDPVADLRVTVLLFDGNPFDPAYCRRYAWYRWFPTRVPPPLPRDFPGVFVRVYEKGALVRSGMSRSESGACRATAAGVTVGADGFTRSADGTMRLAIGALLDLTFRPKSPEPPNVIAMAAGASVAAPHGWVVSNPLCAVNGGVTLRGRTMPFDGFGYQDHNFGAEPVALAARRWLWACAWLDDRAVVVGEVVPSRGRSSGVRLVGADAPGSAVWNARTKLGIPYPTMVDFGDALRLDEPRLVDSLPVLAQLRYRARIGDAITTAVAHVVEPGPASWPVVSPVLGKLMISRA